MDPAVKFQHMEDWVNAHNELFMDSGLTEDIIKTAVSRALANGKFRVRQGLDEMMTFLTQEQIPLLIFSAGITNVLENSKIVENNLQSEDAHIFLSKMYGDNPTIWSDNISNLEKSRYTINALMRMRFCKKNGELEFKHKNINQPPPNYLPWFKHKDRQLNNHKIFFGHWSTLQNVKKENIYPLDHGCFWGGKLSAFNLTKQETISQQSLEH